MQPKKMETQNEKSNGMMYVAGINKYNQLYFESNGRNCFGANIISPPVSINLKTSDCLSFSTFSSHSVTIMNNEPSATIGPNTGNKRVLFNKKRLRKWTRIVIEEQNQIYKPISAICGLEYTLYLLNLATSPDDAPRLAYYHESKNNDAPLILNTSNYVPIALYGGYHLSAAITEEGAILIIDSSIFLIDDHCPRYLTLPQNEKAIQIAFLNKFVYALSSTGQVYKCNILKQNMFERVKCLKEYEIVQISGTKNHILVVTKDGQVLSHGQNRHGQLGVGPDIVSSTKFEVIESLKDYKIIAAYAGTKHSLFQTSNGAIFACGSNLNGQLLLPDVLTNDQIIYEPIPTIIKKGATFCIAGAGLSCAFVNCKPPPMTPNMIAYQLINQPKAQPQKQQPQKPQPQKPLISSNKLKEILELQSQIRELKNNAEAKNNRIIQLRAENMTIIENIDKILLKIDQHEKQNPPKNNKKSPAVTLNKSRPLLFKREELPIHQKKLEKEKEEEEESNQPNDDNEEEEEIKKQKTDESQNEGEEVQQTNNDHIDDEDDDEDSDVDENEEDEENKDNEYEVNKNPVNNENDTNQNDNSNNNNNDVANDNEKLENNNAGFDNNKKDDSDDDFDENENVEDESNENKNSDHNDENDDNLNDADNKENETYNKEDEEVNKKDDEASDKYENEVNKKDEDGEENHNKEEYEETHNRDEDEETPNKEDNEEPHNKDEDEETHNREDNEETYNKDEDEETYNKEDDEENHNKEDNEETYNKDEDEETPNREDNEETHNREDNEETYHKDEDKAMNDDEKINEEDKNKNDEDEYGNYSSDEDNF